MSSTVQNPVVAQGATTSTWDTIKNGAVDSVYWCGRQIKWIYNSIAEWIAPIFQAIGKFFAEMYYNVKEFVVEHKEATITGAVALAAGAILFGVCYHMYGCGEKETSTQAAEGAAKPEPAK